MPLVRQSLAIRLMCAVVLSLGLMPGRAMAAPMTSTVKAPDSSAVSVEITQQGTSVGPKGTMRMSVAVTTAEPADRLEVRIRMRSPSGKLVYQKTDVRTGLPAGQNSIVFERELASLRLKQGRYPIDVRVRVSGAKTITAESRLLVIDPLARRIPVAIAVYASGEPGVTMTGKLIDDPAGDGRLRDDLSLIAQLALDQRTPIALAIPPVLLEQFGRVSGGYETTAGVKVAATDESAQRYARMLQSLESAVTTGAIDLIDVPYAMPDLSGLAQMSVPQDVALHWTRTDSITTSLLHPASHPEVAYIGDSLTREALDSIQSRDVGVVLAPASAITSGETTAQPGCYKVPGSDVRVVVIDEDAAKGAREGAEAFYDALFGRIGCGPVVVMFTVGENGTNSVDDIRRAIGWIGDADWLQLTGLDVPARTDSPAAATLAPVPDSPDKVSYWADVAASRYPTMAFAGAAGPADIDSEAAMRALLTAESSLLTDGRASETVGRALAAEALGYATSEFKLIRLDTKDVTLSGTKGDVPLTLINDTGKPLRLTLNVVSKTGLVPVEPRTIDVQPTQNFLTVPIDLGNVLSDSLTVQVAADGVTVAETTVDVRASYIDRLATVAMVVLIMGGLLLFIRRRVRASDAGTIVTGGEERDRRHHQAE